MQVFILINKRGEIYRLRFIIHYYSQEQLIECGRFSQADLEKIKSYRGSHNKLGFAYQLIYVRLINYFPKQKPFEIIDEILSFAAMQIGINKKEIATYLKHRQHISRHQEHIREYLRLKSFNVSDQLCQFLLEEAHRVVQITLLLSVRAN